MVLACFWRSLISLMNELAIQSLRMSHRKRVIYNIEKIPLTLPVGLRCTLCLKQTQKRCRNLPSELQHSTLRKRDGVSSQFRSNGLWLVGSQHRSSSQVSLLPHRTLPDKEHSTCHADTALPTFLTEQLQPRYWSYILVRTVRCCTIPRRAGLRRQQRNDLPHNRYMAMPQWRYWHGTSRYGLHL